MSVRLYRPVVRRRNQIQVSTLDRIIRETPIHPIFLACILGTFSLNCCSPGGSRAEYSTIRVARRTFSPLVTALGTVKPQVGSEVRLGARIPGKVEHLRANIGDIVTKGQIIAELEKDELQAVVEKRQAELNRALINLAAREALGPIEIERAEADSIRLQAAYELDVIEYEREAALFEQNLTSRQNLDQAEEELLVARAEFDASSKTLDLTRKKLQKDLEELKADVDIVRAELRIAEVELSYATLRAPISGIIASVSTQEGETVAVGLSAPTFVTIIDLDRLQVETYVDEVDIGKIEIGQKAMFSVEAFPSIDIEGEVVRIYPKAILRENVVFYDVVVKSLPTSSVYLRPEMTANVSIYLNPREDALVVPASSVIKTGGTSFVYVIENGKPVRREVQVGWQQGRYLEITGGLNEGDEVLEDHSDYEGEGL